MSNLSGQLDEDDTLGATSDFTEDYEAYLSNLENSYDICISIDFITQRLETADELDTNHCRYLLSCVLPKSVEFLCKTDLNNLYDQDIIQYQKTNRTEYTTNSIECREFLVSKVEKYFEYIIDIILRLKPHYTKEFYDVLKDIFMLTHRLYKPHNAWFDRLSQEYRQQIMDDCSGKYSECSTITLKQYHPNYMKLINYFGSKNGFTIILHEMLDGKKKNKEKNDANDNEGLQQDINTDETPQDNKDKAPSTLTHHALLCYIIALACVHRFLLPSVKQAISERMYQAVEHWYLTMPITGIKQYPRSQVHAILRKLYYLLGNLNSTKREEYMIQFEYLRLEIACKWLCTDSLERKITAWKEFKEYIDTTQRKFDIINNPHKYSNQHLSAYSYCKNPKSVAIYHMNCPDVAQFLHKKNVLNLFLAEDVHEELLKKSFDILYFLGWYNLLNKSYIKMLWSHSIEKTESFVNTVYKVIIDLFNCLSWELIEYILHLIIAIDLKQYNDKIVNLIASFCGKCLYRSTSNSKDTLPQIIAEWHCGLKLLWRAMQSERSQTDSNIPLASNQIQQLSMSKLVLCLQSDSGAVHQEYCKNLCVENLRCSRSVGTSLRVLQHIINAHPIMPPPPPPNNSKAMVADTDNEKKEQKHEEEEEEKEEQKTSGSYFGRESTRSEIIHSLEKHHGILNLYFQDLSRYMSAYNPQSMIEEKTEGDANTVSQPRQIMNFRSRFDFLRFILQYSSLRLSNKQLDDLWDVVIGDTLKVEYSIPYSYKLEQNYFFKWLKDICPLLGSHTNSNANYSPAISIDDAVNLFHTKLGSMPRKTMTSDSLQCLHQYFDLVYELATKKSAASGSAAHPDLSAALDVMWEIAIEAETDTVAQSCGVFILSFYMKPAVHQNQSSNIQSKVSDNILNLINNAANNNSNTSNNALPKVQQPGGMNSINKWEGRTNFVEKCMDYIQQQSILSNYRAVHRCLDLLETFIECTRPGVMRGEYQTESGQNAFGDDSSNDSVIYMGHNASNPTNISWNDFKKTSPWDLGPYAVTNWRLPIGESHFIKIGISNLQLQKDPKNFEIMMNKYSRVGELQDLIAAILNQDVGLLQIQTNSNVHLTPQMSSSTLESCGVIGGCTITVMSIFSLQTDGSGASKDGSVPDGAIILSQNGLYIGVLLELLSSSVEVSGRLWNLLMRLPFNFGCLSALGDLGSDCAVNWDVFIDSSSTFKLLYSLQQFDCVVQHCTQTWLDSLIDLNGLQHLYSTLMSFSFDYTDNIDLYASYRCLYILFKLFASLTSHELIESDPLFTRCSPRHSTPKMIKIRSVSGVLTLFNRNEFDVCKFGSKIFSLILEILGNISKSSDDNNNILLAEIIELLLYQFMSLLFSYSSRLTQLLSSSWSSLLDGCLFCSDKCVRQRVVSYLFLIFVKFNNPQLHDWTLSFLFNELSSCRVCDSYHSICSEYFSFYGHVMTHYCRNLIYFDSSSYCSRMRYFENGALKYAFDSLTQYKCDDEYLLGLFSLIGSILCGFPRLISTHCAPLIMDLKNELIYECLFAVCDPIASALSSLADDNNNNNNPVSIPKCNSSSSRESAFNLLLILGENNSLIWDSILSDLSSIHNKRMASVGSDISFGFSPSYCRRSSSTDLCGLHNYGCTCYMNATMQQLFMNPVVRKVVLGVDVRELSQLGGSGDDSNNNYKSSVFYAMQTMFSNLLWSSRRAVWPSDFLSNYRDFEGNQLDPNEQMDAHEFFNFLFDCLERELRGTVAEDILKNEFCGKCVNQVICQECGYVSETYVPMYAVSCKIQNHSTLSQSLEDEFVVGDWLKGANAYRCCKCNKKVTALKRSCFTQLSNTMLLHLQRFEFNLETMLKVKINSELRFPMKLNMKKYTKSYLEKESNHSDDDDDDSKYEYDLVGITVHSGMADIGHYYSFIRQQGDDGTLGDWFSFNDDYVSLFDVCSISDKCFGGNKLTLIRDSATNELQQRWCAKSNNAYILVYRRSSMAAKCENLLISDQYLTKQKEEMMELKQSETCTNTKAIKANPKEHHLYEIARHVHCDNTRFSKICQFCDVNLVSFLWKFVHLRSMSSSSSSSLKICKLDSDSIRSSPSSIGCKLYGIILYFVWDILCKFESATAINSNSNSSTKSDSCELKKLTPMYSWCEFLKSLFVGDASSAYQFLYILTHSPKRIWCGYLLSCSCALVRQCLVDVLICACKCCVVSQRELYYKNELNLELFELNRNSKDFSLPWFSSASVIVHLVDEMCRNILIASAYWRRLTEFWLFFKLFAQIGHEEKQLLLDRHLIIECYRFYCNKKPFEYGLKQLIKEEEDGNDDERKEDDNDEKKEREKEEDRRIKYERRKMGSNECEPDVHNMTAMLSMIICDESGGRLVMSAADKRVLSDPKIWMKFLEDQQNPHCLAKIVCDLCFKNSEFSKKTCKSLVNYFEEYHDNVYQSGFVVLKAILSMDDYDEIVDDENDDENIKININCYAHLRIERSLTPMIKICREWYRENKYIQSIAKCAQFIDECAQSIENVANYFRNKKNDPNIQWLKQFLNSHSYYLNLPRPPAKFN